MKVSEKVKNLLADYIGVEATDIKDEDFFVEDLHMSATEISDFVESLENAGVDVSKVDLTEIETVEELIESISEEVI